MHYKDYSIAALETSRGRWRARIQRRDGQTIKILIDGDETESFMIGGMESFTADSAVDEAKKLIDGGGIR